MPKKKTEKEIVVSGPPKLVTPPEKRSRRYKEKALEDERFGVLKISQQTGACFSASMLAVGSLLLCISAYVIVTGYGDWIVISSEMPFWGLIVWVFTGITNVVGGLLLMGSE